jgi:phosphatidylglycerophosphatase A
MWIALYLVPHDLMWGAVAFLFFRLFDILKPGPIQIMDDLHSAIGVMMDDVVAGILALLVTQSLLYYFV